MKVLFRSKICKVFSQFKVPFTDGRKRYNKTPEYFIFIGTNIYNLAQLEYYVQKRERLVDKAIVLGSNPYKTIFAPNTGNIKNSSR